jgi:hypothetical protein
MHLASGGGGFLGLGASSKSSTSIEDRVTNVGSSIAADGI